MTEVIPASNRTAVTCLNIWVAILAFLPQTAFAGIIDFGILPDGPLAGDSVTIMSDGIPVTFSGLGLSVTHFNSPLPPTKVLTTNGDTQPVTVTFGGGKSALFVEIENIIQGQYFGEFDTIVGTAYDASNHVIDSKTSSAAILRLKGPGITRVVYDDFVDIYGGYTIANFNFMVPEPSSIALAAFGFVGLMALGWRRRKR